MKTMSIDFKNQIFGLFTDEQETIEPFMEIMQKSSIKNYMSKNLYLKYDNYTLDFERETVTGNESVAYDPNTRYTREMFHPVETEKVIGLEEKFPYILDAMGYAEVQFNERTMDYLDTIGFFHHMLHQN